MTLKTYIWGMRFLAIFSLSALGLIVRYVDPENSGFLGLALFYLVAFFALSAIFNLILVFIRRKSFGYEMAAANVGLSFRQAVLLAILCLGILMLQGSGILVWWDALLVIGGVFLIELYFLSRN